MSDETKNILTFMAGFFGQLALQAQISAQECEKLEDPDLEMSTLRLLILTDVFQTIAKFANSGLTDKTKQPH